MYWLPHQRRARSSKHPKHKAAMTAISHLRRSAAFPAPPQTVKKWVDIRIQRFGDAEQHVNIRPGPASLIVGYCLAADVQLLCQCILDHLSVDSGRPDIPADITHRVSPLCPHHSTAERRLSRKASLRRRLKKTPQTTYFSKGTSERYRSRRSTMVVTTFLPGPSS